MSATLWNKHLNVFWICFYILIYVNYCFFTTIIVKYTIII